MGADSPGRSRDGQIPRARALQRQGNYGPTVSREPGRRGCGSTGWRVRTLKLRASLTKATRVEEAPFLSFIKPIFA